MLKDPLPFLQAAAQAIFDKKGVNILLIDVRGVFSLTDYVLIAEGNVDRHVAAIGREIIDTLRQLGDKPVHVEGLEMGDWVVIDYLNYMIHLFMPGMRDKYQLEEIFREGKIVETTLVV